MNPHVFMELVQAHPRVRLWFSGHFHLSHNYADSISVAAGCVFVQTGVIGRHSSRDGFRQSRLLRATRDAFEVWTVDHEDSGARRLDLTAPWGFEGAPQKLISDDELVCDPAAGYVCARDACSILWHEGIRWFATGSTTLLAQQDDKLIEYDVRTFAPTGMRLCACVSNWDLSDAVTDLRLGAQAASRWTWRARRWCCATPRGAT